MTTITINVQNDSNTTQNFLYFMSPISSSSSAPSYCASLGSASLGNYDQSGTIITFMLNYDYRAGVQQAYSAPVVGQQSGFYSASQAISLATASGSALCATTMALNPLSLAKAVAASGVPSGAFRITTPSYDSGAFTFNAGTALRTAAGGVVLPSFVVAAPAMNIDLFPVKSFHVAIGTAAVGAVVLPSNFPSTGLCDATTFTSFQVIYSASGTFSVTGSVDTTMARTKALPGPSMDVALDNRKRVIVPL